MIDLGDYDLHIFDLDDTLINTKQSYWSAQITAVGEVFPHLTSDHLDTLSIHLKWLCSRFGSGNVQAYMGALLKSEPDLLEYSETNLDRLVERYNFHFPNNLTCFTDSKNYLHKLKQAGHHIAMVTNGSISSQTKKLEWTGLNQFFPSEYIFISGEYPWDLQKPDPFLVELACKKAGIRANRTVFYGNAIVDMLAGKLAGAATLHFAGSTPLPENIPEFVKPHRTIYHWSELI